jgi:PKD repeat protein
MINNNINFYSIILLFYLSLTNLNLTNAIAAPNNILSPVFGSLRVTNTNLHINDGKWEFNQHKTAEHISVGIGGSNDYYAWDVNLYAPDNSNADDGKPVYAIAEGDVVKYAGTSDPGYIGSVLIAHPNKENPEWWSGYLHMENIGVSLNQHVTTSTFLGNIGRAGADNDHLHYVVYTGANSWGNLVSFNANIIERQNIPPPNWSIIKEQDNPDCYLYYNSLKWKINTAEIITDLGFSSGDILVYPIGTLSQLTNSRNSITSENLVGVLDNSNGQVYIWQGSQWHYVPTFDYLQCRGIPYDQLLRITQALFNRYGRGDDIGPCSSPPVADFTAMPTSGNAPLTVNFVDLSSNNPTSWSWKFGDGGTSTAQNPTHVYNNPGVYTVELTATNSAGSNTKTYPNCITVTTLPPTTYTITASAGTGGSISPSGSVTVNNGANQTFTIAANTGYRIADVKVDNVSQGTISSYTFTNVTANHTISATFTAQTWTITASAGNGGSISPSGSVTVNHGANQTFTITPNTGYNIKSVVVDGVSQGPIASYTFTNVTSNHSISASFVEVPKILTNLSTQTIRVPKGKTAVFHVKLSNQPITDTVVSVAKVSGISEISILQGNTLTFTTINWNTYQPVKLAATPDNNNLNGKAIFQLSSSGLSSVNVTAIKVGRNISAFLGLLLD